MFTYFKVMSKIHDVTEYTEISEEDFRKLIPNATSIMLIRAMKKFCMTEVCIKVPNDGSEFMIRQDIS